MALKPNLPPEDTQAYLWWAQGAADEAEARDEDMNAAAREVREYLEAIARLRPYSRTELIVMLARQFCPKVLRWKHRHR